MRVIRTRTIQPDTSPGMVAGGVALVILISLGWLWWWTLLLTLLLVPVVNALLVGKTTRKETTIEKDL